MWAKKMPNNSPTLKKFEVRLPIKQKNGFEQAKCDGGASRTIFELLSEHISNNPIDEKVLDLLLEVA